MRSFDRSMPEELNRVLADHASSLLLCSSDVAVDNLHREGVSGAVELVGDVMVDVALGVQPRARERVELLRERGVEPGAVRARDRAPGRERGRSRAARAARRAAAVGAPPGRAAAASAYPWPPADGGPARTAPALRAAAITPPLSYVELAALLCNARAVLTDSGGLQKEAYLAGVPCITLRPNTEWVETVETGWNTLVDLDRGAMAAALEREPPQERPRCTETATPPTASWPRLHCASDELPDHSRAAGMSASAVRIGVVGLGYWGPNIARNIAAVPAPSWRGAATIAGGARAGRRSPSPGCGRQRIGRAARRPGARRDRDRNPGPDARGARGAGARGRQALLRREAARPVGRRRRARGGRRGGLGARVDGRPPARIPPGDPEAQGVDRRRGARRSDLLHLRQPAESREAARRRERALEPWRTRRLGRAAPGGGRAHRGGRARRVVRPARESRTWCSASCASRRACRAHLHLSWLDPHKERRFTVVGSQRMATFDDMDDRGQGRRSTTRASTRTPADTASTSPASGGIVLSGDPQRGAAAGRVRALRRRIAKGAAPTSDGESGLRVVRVLERCRSRSMPRPSGAVSVPAEICRRRFVSGGARLADGVDVAPGAVIHEGVALGAGAWSNPAPCSASARACGPARAPRVPSSGRSSSRKA